jgi:hypothetical protein
MSYKWGACCGVCSVVWYIILRSEQNVSASTKLPPGKPSFYHIQYAKSLKCDIPFILGIKWYESPRNRSMQPPFGRHGEARGWLMSVAPPHPRSDLSLSLSSHTAVSRLNGTIGALLIRNRDDRYHLRKWARLAR